MNMPNIKNKIMEQFSDANRNVGNYEIDLRVKHLPVVFTGKLLDYKEFIKYSSTFIETGSAAGDGVQRAIDAGFKKISSVEASDHFYDLCKSRFVDAPVKANVEIWHGKSIDRLPEILQLIDENTAVFYLDAHVSGEAGAGYNDWLEKGEESDYAQDKTIKAELALILEYNKYPQVIIIDDVNGLKDGHGLEYMAQMVKANPYYKFYFYDENLSKDPAYYYKDKILVGIPQLIP